MKNMNERSFIYRFGFHLSQGLKTKLFHLKVGKNSSDPHSSCHRSTARCMTAIVLAPYALIMSGVHGCYFPAHNRLFLHPLGAFFLIVCLGTWEQNSSHCNILRGLLNLSCMVFLRSSQVFKMFCIADLHDFFLNYIKTHWICYVLGKLELLTQIENTLKSIPKTINSCSKTPLFWIKTK
jgi:hypothetical protein